MWTYQISEFSFLEFEALNISVLKRGDSEKDLMLIEALPER